MKRGDLISLTYGDQTVQAFVGLASPNGRSLIVFFDGMLGSYLGAMPLFCEDDGQWRGIMDQMLVTVARVPRNSEGSE